MSYLVTYDEKDVLGETAQTPTSSFEKSIEFIKFLNNYNHGMERKL